MSLTLAERERLDYVVEEFAEAIQAIGKVLRHGWHDHKADYKHRVEKEVGHALSVIDTLSVDLDMSVVDASRQKKTRKQKRFHHQ